jgi:nitrogen regulatory protein PII
MFRTAHKITVVTEHFISDDVCRVIEQCGGKGYTLVPVGGKGTHGLHQMQDRATVVEGFDNVMVEAVVSDREIVERIARRVRDECFTDKPGIMYVQPVEVLRLERF